MLPMSLPIELLRKRLTELIKFSKRGYMATLAEHSGVPDGTIHRIAYGKQKTVTYKVWKQLHDAAPELPPPPTIQSDPATYPVASEKLVASEKHHFTVALQHFFPIDEKFKTVEDLALSVGLTEHNVECLLSGDFSFFPSNQQQSVIAHAFGMSLDDFLDAGRNILGSGENVDPHVSDVGNDSFAFGRATTTHPEIVQIVKMAEKLSDEKIHVLKELTLKLFLAHMNDK
jgi:DNA-binding Xre family transcriptional regulator